MKVEILEHFGDDKMIANVARVSYGKYKNEFDDGDIKLLKYLADHEHTSPFRHPQLQFRITCPIYVERQLFKHQIGWSANSISGRYVDFSDSYDIPKILRVQSKSSKQGSDGNLDPVLNDKLTTKIEDFIETAKNLYDELESAGVAKEQCRIILPLCLETTFIWTGSLYAFIHLCKLRLKPDAQMETREVVKCMLDSVKGLENNPFKYSLIAYGY
jgi:thymidylate synthase (FAD)